MKRTLLFITLIASLSFVAAAQKAETKFPGISEPHRTFLQAAKSVTPIPLPTWLPEGFTLEKVELKLGSEVPIYDQVLVAIYSRKLPDGGIQRFAIEAGFDGLGDLPYEPTKILKTGVGEVVLVYEPRDDEGNIERDYAITEWFQVGTTNFHYIGMYGFDVGDKKARAISIDDTVKILTSLQRY